MTTKHFIIGTAGHIDHGKSSLVKALTGTDPDRLPEEKARGMTIDLGFAHLPLIDPHAPDTTYSIGLIDVPGHADFVKNMVAGVGSIDLALFVVAADDGWMPQTEEHLQILTYLGVKHAVVAMTKADLAEDVDFAAEVLRESLKNTPFADALIIPTAAPSGKGLAELKAALITTLRALPEPADLGKPRLPVDRTFSPTGIGTVVTGSLSGGMLKRGQEVILQPAGIKTHLRTIQNHSKDAETVHPGMRAALNLADVSIATKVKKEGVSRGDVVTLDSLGSAADTVDVLLEKSNREVPGQPLAVRPLRNGQKVYWHHGGSNHAARVYFLGAKQLEPGSKIVAELRFSEPVFCFAGDRFVLRDWSKQATVAGGIVLDPDAARANFRKAAQKALLEKRAAEPESAEAFVLSLVQRENAIPKSPLLVKSRFSAAQIQKAVDALTASKRVLVEGNWLFAPDWWKKRLADAAEIVKSYHKTNPQLQGMDVTEFSNAVGPKLPDKKLFELLVANLCASGFVRSGKLLRWGAHRQILPPHLQQAGARVRAALAKNPHEPPNPAELAPTPIDKQALKFLIETGEAVQLDEKAVVSIEAFEKIKSLICEHLRQKGQGTVSDLRQVTNTTRRILVPFLEKLDREGVTRRNGDFRTLKG